MNPRPYPSQVSPPFRRRCAWGCGDRHDTANYDTMTGPVDVSADGVANDGAAGETDNIGTDVEAIDGTNAADTLTATNSVAGGCTVQMHRASRQRRQRHDQRRWRLRPFGRGRVQPHHQPDRPSRQRRDQLRDNTPDVVSCGGGTDTAATDDIDTVSDCETNNVATAMLPVQTVQVPVPVPVKDTTPAKVRVGGVKSSVTRRSFLKSGIRFTLAASEAVSYDVALTGRAKGAHVARAGDLLLATKALDSSGAKTTVKLKLVRATKKAIGKRAKLKLTVIAIDAGGNKTTVSKAIKVK